MMSPRFPLYVLCCGFCLAAGLSFAFGTPDTLFGLAIGWMDLLLNLIFVDAVAALTR